LSLRAFGELVAMPGSVRKKRNQIPKIIVAHWHYVGNAIRILTRLDP
jgi:hypothetical protein